MEEMKEQKDKEHPQPGPNVTVTVDTKPKVVHRGSWTVAEFKKEVGVDETRSLTK